MPINITINECKDHQFVHKFCISGYDFNNIFYLYHGGQFVGERVLKTQRIPFGFITYKDVYASCH